MWGKVNFPERIRPFEFSTSPTVVHRCDSSCFDRSILHGGGVELSSFGEQVVDDGGVDFKFSEEEEDDYYYYYYFEQHAQQ